MEAIRQFIHSPQFWNWHGFVLSVMWVLGSAVGILIKKRSVTIHLLVFALVDYISLFFMGSALYLIVPRLTKIMSWPLIEQLHILGGSLFLVLMIIQHIGGVLSWHQGTRNYGHRKLGTKLAIGGRIIAGVGWMIHQHNIVYGVIVFGLSLTMYAIAERSMWEKIKTS